MATAPILTATDTAARICRDCKSVVPMHQPCPRCAVVACAQCGEPKRDHVDIAAGVSLCPRSCFVPSDLVHELKERHVCQSCQLSLGVQQPGGRVLCDECVEEIEALRNTPYDSGREARVIMMASFV